MPIGDPAEVEHLQANLRFLLNLWDPIGVADAVDDEYDCLLAPLWHQLTRAASRAEIAEYLWFELQDHFGLDPESHGVDQISQPKTAVSRASMVSLRTSIEPLTSHPPPTDTPNQQTNTQVTASLHDLAVIPGSWA